MMIQVLFVIIAFNEVLIETALDYVSYIPVIGARLQAPMIQFLEDQKKRLHAKGAVQNVSKFLSFSLPATVVLVWDEEDYIRSNVALTSSLKFFFKFLLKFS